MDGTYSPRETLYTFLDTLDAGEARLVQLVDLSGGTPADVRITSPDIRMLHAAEMFSRMETTVGDSVDIYAYFYNMGTTSRDSVFVTLYDSTADNLIGSDTLEFDGLGYFLPGSCRAYDRSAASFGWRPDSTDIGVHRFTAAAATWTGEPDSEDNSVDFVLLVNPRDYATEVRGDPWDMDEDTTITWNTGDIDSVTWYWSETGWTDSVSGMFEGVIDYNDSTGWFRGAISLAIPNDSTDYIDTDKYNMLSFGITVNNPNTLSDNACAMKIGWRDNLNVWHEYVGLLSDTDFHVGNGWDRWSVIGPIDLDSTSGLGWGNGGDASEFWLKIQGSGTCIDPPAPVNVRISWVRLEED